MDLAVGESEGHGSVDGAADVFGGDAEVFALEEGAEGFLISFADVEEALGIHDLGAAGDADDGAGGVEAELTGGAEELGQSGVEEHAGTGAGLFLGDTGIGEHGVEEAADFGDGVVDGDAEAGAEGVGGEGEGGLVGDHEVRHTDHEALGEACCAEGGGGHSGSVLLIVAGAKAPKRYREPDQAFGMADEQVAGGDEEAAEGFHELLLGVSIEVDHHVAAEHSLETVGDIGEFEQVHLPEGDALAELGFDAEEPFFGADAALEVFSQPGGGQRAEAGVGVDAGLGLAEHLGTDVGGQDAPVPTVGWGEGLIEVEGEAVGFFTAGAGGAPEVESAGLSAEAFRECFFDEESEVVFLAEEAGEVGGEGVDDVGDFLGAGVGAEMVAVVGEAGVAEGAHAFAEAGADEGLFALVELDSGAFVNELDDEAAGLRVPAPFGARQA